MLRKIAVAAATVGLIVAGTTAASAASTTSTDFGNQCGRGWLTNGLITFCDSYDTSGLTHPYIDYAKSGGGTVTLRFWYKDDTTHWDNGAFTANSGDDKKFSWGTMSFPKNCSYIVGGIYDVSSNQDYVATAVNVC